MSEVEHSLRFCKEFLEHRKFESLLGAAESILKDHPNEFKVKIFKVEALLALNEYNRCLIYLAETTKALKPLNQHDETYHERCDLLMKYSREAEQYVHLKKYGSHDMSLFVPDRRVRYDKVPTFTGPVEIVNALPGKGRGLIATQDIIQGQLLLVSKAIDIIYDWKKGDTTLENLITERLRTDVNLRKVVFGLHPGPELGFLVSQPNEVPPPELWNRVYRICKMNCFGSSATSTSSRGLWVLPAFLNNDCIDFNCSWKCLGDLFFLRAVKPIRAGNELLICYREAIYPFEWRRSFFQHQGRFTCKCRLCEYQSKENVECRAKQIETIQNVCGLSTKTNGNMDTIQSYIKYAENCTQHYEAIVQASEKPEWNFSLSNLFHELRELHKQAGNVEAQLYFALRYYHVVNRCASPYGHGFVCIQDKAARFAAELFLQSGDLEQASNWIGILKKDLSTVYGEGDVFKLIFPDLHRAAVEQGIDC